MIYKTLYDKLKGRSIDNDSESDVVLRLKNNMLYYVSFWIKIIFIATGCVNLNKSYMIFVTL